MSREKILYAYCEDIGRVVNIVEASRIYLSLDNPPKDFTFYCANELCKKKGVKVSAVNYNKIDETICQAPHFRNNTRQKELHDPGCEWHDKDNASYLNKKYGDYKGQYKRANALDLLIKKFVFDDIVKNSKKHTSMVIDKSENLSNQQYEGNKDAKSFASEVQTQHETCHLDILANAYEFAKQNLPEEDFNKYEISIPHIGKTLKIKTVFRKFEYVLLEKHLFYIMYGNAVLRADNAGFYFKFYEQVNNYDVTLRISFELLNKYKFKRYILANLDAIKDKDGYCKVYFIPTDIQHILLTILIIYLLHSLCQKGYLLPNHLNIKTFSDKFCYAFCTFDRGYFRV